jgi:hypothetical protein
LADQTVLRLDACAVLALRTFRAKGLSLTATAIGVWVAITIAATAHGADQQPAGRETRKFHRLLPLR